MPTAICDELGIVVMADMKLLEVEELDSTPRPKPAKPSEFCPSPPTMTDVVEGSPPKTLYTNRQSPIPPMINNPLSGKDLMAVSGVVKFDEDDCVGVTLVTTEELRRLKEK